ncbi:MAG: aldo/keto reductase [Candidatus Omnitrophota bacterium]
MNNKLTKKICLGTVQFGMDYGIANKTGKVSKEEVFKILDFAKTNGIETLDTAHAYGVSEKVLGEFIKDRGAAFDIVSKISDKGQLRESLSLLGAENIHGCLIHNFKDHTENTDLWKTIENAKKDLFVKKIGFSLYKTQELETVLEQNLKFDIIQVPYSIFDRRFEPYFRPLKDRGVEIHTRSAFLQGLFFMNPGTLPEKVMGAKKHLEMLRKLAKENNISISSLCLNFVLDNPCIDKVVIGVDSLSQLKQNIHEIFAFTGMTKENLRITPLFCHSRESGNPNQLQLDDEKILLPFNWGKIEA